jgi:hypothetical protein
MNDKEFSCRRCGHAAITKQNLIKHLNNKEKCEVKKGYENISIEAHIESLKKKPSDNAVACKFCGSLFNHANYLKSHYTICKRNPDSDKFEGHSTRPHTVHQTLAIVNEELKTIKKENINLRKENNEIKKENNELKTIIEELRKQIPSKNINVVNNGSGTVVVNQYITQNITIKNFGEETLDHISEQFLLNCIMRETAGIRNLVEKIHFDQDVPGNNNIRYKSTKRKIMEIVENNDWVAKDEKEIIRQMIRKACSILREYYYQDESLMERDERELHMKVLGFLDEVNEYKRKYNNAKDMLKALIETNRT